MNVENTDTGIVKVKAGKHKPHAGRIIAGIIIVVIALLAAWRIFFAGSRAKDISVEQITKKDLVQTLSITGNIEANRTDKYTLSPSQKVAEVMVEEGRNVTAGTPLVRLDTTDLEYQLEKARINLNAAKANQTNSLKSLQDGVTQAQYSLDKANGDLDQQKKKFEANQELYDGGFISKDEYDVSSKTLSDMERQVKLAEMQLESAQRSLDNYDSSQTMLQIDQYRADVDNLNKKISDSTIISGIDGKVIRMDALEGQYPKSDKNIIMVCDFSVYKLTTGLSQYDAIRLKTGEKVNIKIKGIDKVYTGTVSKIGEVANVTVSGANQDTNVDIEITLNDADALVKSGYEADGDIILKELNGVIAVNFDSIKQDAGGKYVYIVENGRIAKKYITTGIETDFDVEVTSGFEEGDWYIPSPPDNVKEGTRVKIPGAGGDNQ